MIIIGVTGRIASGKSTVSRILAGLGAVIIDADLIAREIVEPGRPALATIREEFGDRVIKQDGTLDRKALGLMVFSDSRALKRLNELTHPEIKRIVAERIRKAVQRWGGPPAAVVVDAAVLREAGLEHLVDVVWVVTADKDVQVERLVARNGYSMEEALRRIESQREANPSGITPPGPERIEIENNGSVDELERKVKALWSRFVGDVS